MRIEVANSIRLVGAANSGFAKWFDEILVLDNPDFHKKEQMGKWTGGTPRSIVLYERDGEDIIIPFGMLSEMWKQFGDRVEWDIQIQTMRRFPYNDSINLYDYQENAVKCALRAKNGVLVMPCGSGKTQCGLEIIARLGGRALWLTHTMDLLNQSKERAESLFNPAPGMFGKITEGKIDIGTHITFATVQTMCNIDLNQYKNWWDIIIVDECQHCCGSPTRVTQFYKVVNSLCARYKFGLTATPKRADGLEQAMFALLGPVFCTVPKEAVAERTCPIIVKQVFTGWEPDEDQVLMPDGTIDYAKVIDALTHDDERFDFVLRWINSSFDRTIVLANRVEYLQRLCDAYNRKGICISGAGNSKAAKERRKAALMQLNNGEIDCIFATYQLAKEGLDVPNLRFLVLATPEKDETTVVQAVGRVGRKADGKEFGIVVDFVDRFGMYFGWAKKRRGYYNKLNAGLEVLE